MARHTAAKAPGWAVPWGGYPRERGVGGTQPDSRARAPRAVIFDLFHTLVRGFEPSALQEAVVAMGAAVGMTAAQARAAYQQGLGQWMVGCPPSLPAIVRSCCQGWGLEPGPERVQAALAIWERLTAKGMAPRPDAAEVLRRLRACGWCLGLISNCTPEVPALWRRSPLAPLVDAAVFSSEEGCSKPAAAIYLRACQLLDVQPDACLYVGDGAGGELAGALSLGMAAVQLQVPGEPGDPSAEQVPWQGTRIGSLTQLLDWLAAGERG